MLVINNVKASKIFMLSAPTARRNLKDLFKELQFLSKNDMPEPIQTTGWLMLA